VTVPPSRSCLGSLSSGVCAASQVTISCISLLCPGPRPALCPSHTTALGLWGQYSPRPQRQELLVSRRPTPGSVWIRQQASPPDTGFLQLWRALSLPGHSVGPRRAVGIQTGTQAGCGYPDWQSTMACFGLGGREGGREESRSNPVMNLDHIQLPLLLNSLGGLGVASAAHKGPRVNLVDSVSMSPRQQAGVPPGPRWPPPWPGLGRARVPRGPRSRPTRPTAARAGVPAPRALRWVVWGPGRFRAHLPANALTLSAPIIIQSALLRAAIPYDWLRLKRLRPSSSVHFLSQLA
jgi:hypothetical protein